MNNQKIKTLLLCEILFVLKCYYTNLLTPIELMNI